MEQDIQNVAVLGANGVMGALTGSLLAKNGFHVVLFCRTEEKCADAMQKAVKLAHSEETASRITCKTYDQLENTIGDVDWIIECLAEDLTIKRSMYTKIDGSLAANTIISTMTSSFPLHVLSEGRSARFRRSFLAVHLFNPPNRLLLCEIAGSDETEEAFVRTIIRLVESRLQRIVVRVSDSPGFIANRIGFLVFSEITSLAPMMGIQKLDYMFGPYTGRALAPFATIDLIGLDIYQAIIHNLRTYTNNGVEYIYALPEYLERMIGRGMLGRKTPDIGGLYHRDREHRKLVYDIGKDDYTQLTPVVIPFIEDAKQCIREDRYTEAFQIIMNDCSEEARMIKQTLLTYISYSFHCIRHVFNGTDIENVDHAMSHGFNWLPPSKMLDLMGTRDEVIGMMAEYDIHVPGYLSEHRQPEDHAQNLEIYKKYIKAR